MKIIFLHVQSQVDQRFDCPICTCNSFCDIYTVNLPVKMDVNIRVVVCRACGNGSIWRRYFWNNNEDYYLGLVDPIPSDAPTASSEKE